ncbi:Ldh family oxidoreductase [Natronorubrum sp. FCH18a]|uniref:Ldh family oxidoreductase n=1 Tax=Natronorubrum sp. FCH18a TaxID=3447018 RepID=UPI003F513164
MPRVQQSVLEPFTEALLVALDTPRSLAPDVAESLVTADLRGHSSHGVRQLVSKYADEITDGKIEPSAVPRIEREGEPWALVDGNLAYGQLAGRLAVDTAIERASEHGIGLVSLKRVSHIGRVGEFAERACESGMAFVGFVSNPGSAWVAPPGSAQRRFSTNPIAIGVPTFGALEFPLVADLSTAQVAHGKIKERAASGESVPDEWLVADSGESMTDPVRFEESGDGAIFPLGGRTAGYKGFNLSVMTELLTANVADGTVSGMSDVIWGNHATFFVVDLEAVTSPERIAERADAIAEYVRSTDFSADLTPGTAAAGDETLLPGEAEHASTARCRDDGIPFSSADAAALAALARDEGVDETLVPASFQ